MYADYNKMVKTLGVCMHACMYDNCIAFGRTKQKKTIRNFSQQLEIIYIRICMY